MTPAKFFAALAAAFVLGFGVGLLTASYLSPAPDRPDETDLPSNYR